MELFGVPVGLLGLTFAVAAIVTAVELLTSQYPRTARFALQSAWFYAYFIIYGLLGAVALAILPLVSDQIMVEGVGVSNPWVKAALIGFSVKAVLHIRIFSVTTGPGQSFPVGLESLVQLFEPWMLRQLELDHYDTQLTFIEPRATTQKFPDVNAARTRAKENPPPGLSDREVGAFESDIDHSANTTKVIGNYLKYAGIKLTKRTFP